MNILKMIINKEVFYMLFVHFVCADKYLIYVYGFFYCLLILEPYDDMSIWAVGDIPFIIIYVIIKLFSLIIYYKNDYKRVKSPLVIRLIELLKTNKNHSRLIFLFIVTLPYNINTLFNMLTSYDWLYRFFENTCLMYGISSFISYKLLFYYWDVSEYKQKNNTTFYMCIKVLIKKSWVFVLISILIFVSFFALIPYCSHF